MICVWRRHNIVEHMWKTWVGTCNIIRYFNEQSRMLQMPFVQLSRRSCHSKYQMCPCAGNLTRRQNFASILFLWVSHRVWVVPIFAYFVFFYNLFVLFDVNDFRQSANRKHVITTIVLFFRVYSNCLAMDTSIQDYSRCFAVLEYVFFF